MSTTETLTAAGLMSSGDAYEDEAAPGLVALQVQQRYGAERAKRLRDEGNRQFIDTSLTEKYRHFQDDPWVDPASVKDIREMFTDAKCQLLILGAGIGGLMYAVRMIQAGVAPGDIRLVDTAGGFGGAWYWNRYPGINCDVESYCYLPLLEETGYVPKQRFSSGEEIREYGESIARHWKVAGNGVFQTKADRLEWNEGEKTWKVTLTQSRKDSQPETVEIRSQFVATVNGALHWLKLPDLPGILDYGGNVFHSARWDYSFTGGAPGDISLTKLQSKRIALIGTGASGIQLAPHVAKWANHLYIVQRTPAAVDVRENRETDEEVFNRSVAQGDGWQRERLRNFHQHLTTGKQPDTNLVNDGWTRAMGMVAVAGNPDGPQAMDELPAYMQKLYAMDLPRQNRIRQRVSSVVKDPTLAQKLLPWYPSWCKRPCFSDEYLQIFNQDNVTLLDTDGAGMERVTANGIVVNGQEYPVDAIIFATGFRAPVAGTPAEKGNMRIIGRDGISMTEAWAKDGPTTLHGVLDQRFPNLFLSGLWQSAISPNNLFNTNALAEHSAYILTEALQKAAGKPVEVTSTPAAVEDWGMQILMRSPPMAAALGCTPNYFNMEGDMDRIPPEAQMQVAKSGLWGKGIEDFCEHIAAWRAEGNMQGIEVRT